MKRSIINAAELQAKEQEKKDLREAAKAPVDEAVNPVDPVDPVDPVEAPVDPVEAPHTAAFAYTVYVDFKHYIKVEANSKEEALEKIKGETLGSYIENKNIRWDKESKNVN